MAWYVWALLGAFIWGIHYNFLAKVMQVASPITAYFIPTILLLLGLPFYYKILIDDIRDILASTTEIKAMTVAIAFTSIVGSISVYKAIHGSNATLASLIEITYPLCVALFAYFILKETHLSVVDVVGGLLIISGTGIIIWNAS